MTCAQALAIAAAAFVLGIEPLTAPLDQIRADVAALAGYGDAVAQETAAALRFDAKPGCSKKGWALM
jgi:hypothetical protein